jgi:hypothetical protein
MKLLAPPNPWASAEWSSVLDDGIAMDIYVPTSPVERERKIDHRKLEPYLSRHSTLEGGQGARRNRMLVALRL